MSYFPVLWLDNIKGLTDDNKVNGNIDGNKVKVVLISKAGSEGIDFKFIRQIHILEPWYNMNRIEQIIGRGVRSLSHALLPFEKRNVEIFMYGTILGNNKEEAADVYVYRVAEFKAIQIGKVTRVLKETAVDCIINEGQNNFTQKQRRSKIQQRSGYKSKGAGLYCCLFSPIHLLKFHPHSIPPNAALIANATRNHHVDFCAKRQIEQSFNLNAVEAFHWAGIETFIRHSKHECLSS
jgi:hypothetical protein